MRMDHLIQNADNFISNAPPILREHFNELFFEGRIGICPFTVNDVTPLCKEFRDTDDSFYNYHFTLKIPYAGSRLSWELIFDPEDLRFAPDFDFNDDVFMRSPDISTIMNEVPSLADWNVTNPTCLKGVLHEFLELYKRVQLNKLLSENTHSQIKKELDTLLAVFPLENIEVQVENTFVQFLFNLKIEKLSFPDYVQPTNDDDLNHILLNPGEDTCILKVSFVKLDCSKVNTQLQLSPRLEQVLGSSKNLHIPMYNTRQHNLLEYVELITTMIHKLVRRVEQHHRLKKEYVNCLCTVRSKSMLEYDAEQFNSASFLCEVDDYCCIVHVNIGSNFPLERPTVSLRSIYCAFPKKPCSVVIDDYPYNPGWSPEDMVTALMDCLREAIIAFKDHKH